jgi:hypothetical protein
MPSFITKSALPRRTFLKGVGATLALPLLDAMVPAATAATKTPALPVRRLGYVFMPMGCDQSRWTPLGTDGTLNELSPILQSLAPHRVHQPRAAQRLPRFARHLEFILPQRRQGEAHRELRLLSWHDRRPARRTTNRPRLPASLARTRDGHAPNHRPVRQRLRVRLPK